MHGKQTVKLRCQLIYVEGDESQTVQMIFACSIRLGERTIYNADIGVNQCSVVRLLNEIWPIRGGIAWGISLENLPFSIAIYRFISKRLHQRCDYYNWEALRTAFVANWLGSQWLWHCLVRVSGAGYLFRWKGECIETTMDRYRHDSDGVGFDGLLVAAFFGWIVSSNKCRNQSMSHRTPHKHGKFVSNTFSINSCWKFEIEKKSVFTRGRVFLEDTHWLTITNFDSKILIKQYK